MMFLRQAGTETDDEVGTRQMANFLCRMQPGKGPSLQLASDLAALGSLVETLQQLVNRITSLEVRNE